MDTSALPASVVQWNRSGNSAPNGGYIMPLMPGTWFRDAPIAATVFAGLDTALETGRFYLDVLRASHIISLAVGTDLDDLGAILGVPRLAGEGDNQYRVRIPATALHGASASSIPDMTSYLSAALGVPVQVQDTGVGMFSVTLLSTVPNPTIVMPLIKTIKAAGTKPTAQMLTSRPYQTPPLFGSFRFGGSLVGTSGIIIPIT